MATAAPRFIAYLRVSTGEQADSGLGLEAQEASIREACERRGWQLVHVYRDEGRTGANLKRKGVTDALKRIARDVDVDGLVVAKLDRISRSSTDTALLIDWMANEARRDFVALDVDFADTTSPAGKMVVGIVALFAEWERAQGALRTRASMRALKAQGKRTGPGAVSDRTALARRVKAMRETDPATGKARFTFQEIADTLNREGVPTLRGGTEWRPSALQTVLGWERPPKRRPRTSLPRVGRGRR